MEENQKITKQEKRLLRREERSLEQIQVARKRLFRKITMWTGIFAGLGLTLYLMILFVNRPLPETKLTTEISANDHIKGNPAALTTLVEYSDFQCPACASYFPLVKKLLEENDDAIRFVYRHFPLPQHKNARLAASVAEAAGLQNKFWEMHDLIFENQFRWENLSNAKASEEFTKYATQLGLNLPKFTTDLDSEELKTRVEADYLSGNASGVNSTPTFFLNGKKMLQPRDYENFKNIVLGA